MSKEIQDNIYIKAGKPVEPKSMNGVVPYTNVAQALSLLPKSVRYISLIVNIAGGFQYWFKNGVEDSDLEILSSGNGLLYNDQNYEIVRADGTPTQNGTALLAALTRVKAKTPNGNALGFFNRAVLYLLAGSYDLGSSQITLGTYVDIKGLGSSRSVVLDSTNAVGTILIQSSNDYVLENLTIRNSNSGCSIANASSSTDNGVWNNLELYAQNTFDTIFNGEYDKVYGKSDYILCGSISGNVRNSFFQNYSCGYSDASSLSITGKIKFCEAFSGFGYSNAGAITITGEIFDCKILSAGFGYSSSGTILFNSSSIIERCLALGPAFGYSNFGNMTFNGLIKDCDTNAVGFGQSGGSPIITITGKFINCNSFGGPAFGYTSGDITFSGLIDNCSAVTSGFIHGDVITFSGTISNSICKTGNTSFGAGNSGVMSGYIYNCHSTTSSFGFDLSVSGVIENCVSELGGQSFGITTSVGKLIKCICLSGEFSIAGNHLGMLLECHGVSTSVGALDAIKIGNGCVVQRCTFIALNSAKESINVATSASVKIYFCSLNKAPNSVSGNAFTNLITTPYNVIDSNITG